MERSYCKKSTIFTVLALLTVCSSSVQLSATGQELHDNNEYCKIWADRGECNLNPNYMLKECAKSCYDKVPKKQCALDNNSGKPLRNFHTECEEWATDGECDLNRLFMFLDCAKSCNDFYKRSTFCTPPPKNQCQLYMAESSIPNAGLGMFTSVHIKPYSDIFHPDVVINVVDFRHHNQMRKELERRQLGEWNEVNSEGLSDKNEKCFKWATDGECNANPAYMLESCKRSCTELPNLEKEYKWLPDSYYWNSNETSSRYEAYDVQSLVPGLGMLANSHLGLVNVYMNRPSIDSAGLDRKVDPGAGAFSSFHGLSYGAKRPIPAGMEIFSDYGNKWFSDRDQYSFVPLSWDYRNADKLLHTFTDFVRTKGNTFAKELLSFIQTDLISDNRLRSLLPSDVDEAKKAQKQGAAMYSLPNAIRSDEWFEKNAYCLDNIEPRKSSLPQAGRGAFATRKISKGDVVAPAPMVHLNKSQMHMYRKQGGFIEHWGEQLIMNYCYGHPRSSLLLLPYSPVTNFINHNSERSKVNTRIQWSKLNHKEWFELSVEEVLSKNAAGLVMEFRAIRDILEGEEIFIDYGSSWEDAWENHVDNWTPTNNTDNYVPVELLNKEDEIMTVEEQKAISYPQNAFTICILPEDLILTVDQNKKYQMDWVEVPQHNDFKYARKCNIFERYQSPHTNETLYRAEIQTEVNIVVNNVPRRAIQFFDDLYTADQHQEGVFRHEIGIPDAIFPIKWINLD